MLKKKILEPIIGRGGNPDYESYTHKICNKCKSILLIEKFNKTKTKTKRGWAYRSNCRNCDNKQLSKYSKTHKTQRNKRLREWRKKNPKLAKLKDLRSRYKTKYGITLEQLEQLRKSNNYRCWICNKEDKRLIVDHDHKTGKVRGILCDICNRHIGYFENMDFKKMQQYLNKKCHADILIKVANA